MRVLAAIVAFVVCSCCQHAFASSSKVDLPRALLSALGIKKQGPAHRLLTCGQTLGLTKCFNALSVWRAEHAIEALETGRAVLFDAAEDVRRFPWEQYNNSSDEQLYSQLCDGTEKLLQYRSLSLSLPGYSLELESKGKGILNVDILKNDDIGSGRSKSLQKQFYDVLPMLLLPGLIMSAILPFVLPALKLMTVGVGILNNMALTGAVFTLLRNNAFSDKYEHKIIYANEGYKNEKLWPVHMQDESQFEEVEVPLEFQESNVKGFLRPTDEIVQVPTNLEFIKQFYGNEGMKYVRRSQITPDKVKTPEEVSTPGNVRVLETVSRRKSRD